MPRVLLYYVHPGQKHSKANKAMYAGTNGLGGITRVDLYAEYPRFNIDIDKEQSRLLAHDVIVFQHPLFWYSVPSLLKEWVDLVLEHGFAYGAGGDRIAGKICIQAITTAGPEAAYTERGYQRFPLRTFLTPMEQTARLCSLRYTPPYVLYGALRAESEGHLEPHISGYRRLLEALRDGSYEFDRADGFEVIHHRNLPIGTPG